MPTDSTSVHDNRRRKGDPAPLDQATLALILLIVREAYEQRGIWLSVTEVQAKLARPGL